MDFLKLWRYHHVLGLMAYVVWPSDATRHRPDYSKDEMLLYRYHRSKNELNWIWSERSFCRVLCPHRMRIGMFSVWIGRKEVLLEAPSCTKVEMEVHHCSCETRQSRNGVVHVDSKKYVNGPNGQVYRVHVLKVPNCDEEEAYVITDHVFNNISNTFTFLPTLLGVGQIFENRNTNRVPAREWNEDRVASGEEKNLTVEFANSYLNALEVQLETLGQIMHGMNDDTDEENGDYSSNHSDDGTGDGDNVYVENYDDSRRTEGNRFSSDGDINNEHNHHASGSDPDPAPANGTTNSAFNRTA